MLTAITIGNKIAKARKKVNISQAQLAEQLFISPQAVGKWERGESMPDITTFIRIAEILGVDLNYFSDNFISSIPEMSEDELNDTEKIEILSDKKKKRTNWDLSKGNWIDADFSGLDTLHEKFSSSNMQRCLLKGSDLSGLHLKSNNIDSCDFSGSVISFSIIQNSNLHRNIFKSSSLRESKITSTNIEHCDFSDSNLTGTEFVKSCLYGCNLNGADFTSVLFKSVGFSGVVKKTSVNEFNTITNAELNCTSFIETQIADITFTGKLEDCCFENCSFTRVVFQNVTFINTFFKNNEKLSKVKFIDCKADSFTYSLLKNGKADMSGIEMIS